MARRLPATEAPATALSGSFEIRLHGRGGQGGVTCAKILAAVYARLGKSVQTFGDYAGERSGAPIRAYTRVGERPIENRNKVYRPNHVLVLDPTLLGDEAVAGLAPGGTLLVNTTEAPDAVASRFGAFRLATVDATSIARRHKIGTRSVVIVNTTIAGAFARALSIPLGALEEAYVYLGLQTNFPAAKEAYETVRFREAAAAPAANPDSPHPNPLPKGEGVLPLTEHVEGLPTGLKTGSWRTQAPRYVEKLAPCSAYCPAGNDVVGFVQALAHGNEAAAAAVLGHTTPLSAVCGRVCPAPCMQSCNRGPYDGAVNVRGLERWIADRAPVALPKAAPAAKPQRIAIVGGGPAGLSAAYALASLGHRAVVFEAEPALGGVLRTGIPTYRLPREALDREVAKILELGVEARCGERTDRTRIAALAREHDAVILSTGLQRLRPPGIPGEELAGVEQGIHFLHRINSAEDAQIRGHVVVLGGGNTAMDCARGALRAGAERVTVAYRRGRAQMPAIAEEVEQAEEEGVRFLFLRQPVAFTGKGRIVEVELAEVELGPPDQSGRRAPLISERRERLACDTVLLALGQSADLSLLPEGWELREGQAFAAGRPLPVFAAGDLATNDGTVAHAIGDGRRAALRALRSLGIPAQEPPRPERASVVPPEAVRLHHFASSRPATTGHLPAASRTRHFDEVDSGLSDGAEAKRCFSCGRCTHCDTCLVFCPEGIIHRAGTGYEVDYAFCKGCGICVAECPRNGMEMKA